MKSDTYIKLLIVTATLLFSSCEKDESAKPLIDEFELGYQNSKKATLGNDLHINAEVVAAGRINTIQVEIHSEEEHGGKGTGSLFHDGEWAFDSTYTEFKGLKNTSFHKHVDIPVTAEAGTYHFHFIVTDLEGNQTEIEEDLMIEQPDDTQAPVITITQAPAPGVAFTNGQTITIKGTITDDQMLGGLYIGLVRNTQNLDDAAVNAVNTITMLHTHDFTSPAGHTFNASIVVGAVQDNNDPPKAISGGIAWQSGNYYVLVKSTDAFGGNWAYSSHYPVVINY